MLQKRTNILFDEQMFTILAHIGKTKNTSIGALVRYAVKEVYLNKSYNDGRKKALDSIILCKKGLGKITTKQIKEYINYGRKI